MGGNGGIVSDCGGNKMNKLSLFEKPSGQKESSICPICNEKTEMPDYRLEYFTCDNCNAPLLLTKDFIKMPHSQLGTEWKYLDQQFTKWLLEEKHISETTLINAKNPKKQFDKVLLQKFLQQARFDILIHSKGGGAPPYLCNKKVSHEKAKEICSREDTKFVNSFATFSLSGTWTDTRKGEPFSI